MSSIREVPKSLLKPRYSIADVALVFTLSGLVAFWWVRETMFQSPLPNVRVAAEGPLRDLDAYSRQYDFTRDYFTRNIPVWDKVLAPMKGKPNIQYLEIGVYEGRSAIWMLENVLTHETAGLTCIDIFDGPYKNNYEANIELSGSSNKVMTISDFSQLAMRTLPVESFDVVYIDGSHSKDDVLEDAVLSWRLLKKGGILIFDDYRWTGLLSKLDGQTDFPKAAIDPFVQCFDRHLEVLHNSYQLILKKE